MTVSEFIELLQGEDPNALISLPDLGSPALEVSPFYSGDITIVSSRGQ